LNPGLALKASRALPAPVPLWMGILNLTPDSFSDGGELGNIAELERRLDAFDAENTQILDFGAESTRPGATQLTSQEEWSRLKPALELARRRFSGRIFKPWISVDTYHAETAEHAIEFGADVINDVSGLASDRMLDVLSDSACQY